MEEIEQWKLKTQSTLANEMVSQKELQTLIDIIKREQATMVKAHFENYQKTINKQIALKADSEEVKKQLHLKADVNEMKNEVSKLRSIVAQVGEGGGGGATAKNMINSGLKVLIRQETDKKVSALEFNDDVI